MPQSIGKQEALAIEVDKARAALEAFKSDTNGGVLLEALETDIRKKEAFIIEGNASVGGQGRFDATPHEEEIQNLEAEALPLRQKYKNLNAKFEELFKKQDLEIKSELSAKEWDDLDDDYNVQQILTPASPANRLSPTPSSISSSISFVDRIKAIFSSSPTTPKCKSPEPELEKSESLRRK